MNEYSLFDEDDFDAEQLEEARMESLRDTMAADELILQLQAKEMEELRLALEMSNEEAAKSTCQPAEDQDAIETAIALSLQDAEKNDNPIESEVHRGQQNPMLREEIPYPTELSDVLWEGRLHLQQKLGVGVFYRAEAHTIVLTSRNQDALIIAKQEFEHIIATSASRLRAELTTLASERVHIFVDNSNIFLGSQLTLSDDSPQSNTLACKAMSAPSVQRDFAVRLNVKKLSQLVISGRRATQKVIFGSHPPPTHPIWQEWKLLGYNAHVTSGGPRREELVDDALVAMIGLAINKFQPSFSSDVHPPTLVLLTGDGNDNSGRASFVQAVESALCRGWKVEVWTWRLTSSRHYRRMQEEYGSTGRFQLHYLDPYRDRITYRCAVRVATSSGSHDAGRTPSGGGLGTGGGRGFHGRGAQPIPLRGGHQARPTFPVRSQGHRGPAQGGGIGSVGGRGFGSGNMSAGSPLRPPSNPVPSPLRTLSHSRRVVAHETTKPAASRADEDEDGEGIGDEMSLSLASEVLAPMSALTYSFHDEDSVLVREALTDEDLDQDEDDDVENNEDDAESIHASEMYFLSCPITLDVFHDPVRTPRGHYFERSALLAHLQRQPLCPLSRESLSPEDLLPPETKMLQQLAVLKRSLEIANSSFEEMCV